MKRIETLITPSFLVEMNKLEENLKEMAELCRANGKKLCPMVKTHKSAAIAALQSKYGVDSFLTGTLDEAEKLIENGHAKIVLAYPVAGAENIARVLALAAKAHVTLSFDGVEVARQFDAALAERGLAIDYLLIIDCGLHRFGVEPDGVVALAQALSGLTQLRFKGIATHPGHVYGKSDLAGVGLVAEEEMKALQQASDALRVAGFPVAVVATGSTPTAPMAVRDDNVTTVRPGNYAYYDAIQVALGVIPEERCALTVLATVVANPKENLFIMDAGSKCFGLDKGAHGVALLNGFGIVKGHPELVVESLSEEVGKIRATGQTSLAIGDKIEIIPNHACAAANMTSYLIAHRNGNVEDVLNVDARGGAAKRSV